MWLSPSGYVAFFAACCCFSSCSSSSSSTFFLSRLTYILRCSLSWFPLSRVPCCLLPSYATQIKHEKLPHFATKQLTTIGTADMVRPVRTEASALHSPASKRGKLYIAEGGRGEGGEAVCVWPEVAHKGSQIVVSPFATFCGIYKYPTQRRA